MIIGLLSDTHNHEANTRQALQIFREESVEHIIHCGDITSPAIVALFSGWQVTFALGNIDYNRLELMQSAGKIEGAVLAEAPTLELAGKRIAVCHGHRAEVLDGFIRSGLYDYVFHGHTHRRRDEWVRQTQVVNPGALGGTYRQARSLCILDLVRGDKRFIETG